eukprot:1150286-Pelagomonas_calceolata.AAC.10
METWSGGDHMGESVMLENGISWKSPKSAKSVSKVGKCPKYFISSPQKSRMCGMITQTGQSYCLLKLIGSLCNKQNFA